MEMFIIYSFLKTIYLLNPPQNPYECFQEELTAIVNVNFQVDAEVADAINASQQQDTKADGSLSRAQSAEDPKLTATRKYCDRVLAGLNPYLLKYKLQLNAIVKTSSILQTSISGKSDKSCEKFDPVLLRNKDRYEKLIGENALSIGFNVYITGCVYHDPKYVEQNIIPRGICGRQITVLWQGVEKTRREIKSSVMEALSGQKNTIVPVTENFVLIQKLVLCQYLHQCLSKLGSKSGILVPGYVGVSRLFNK